MSRWWLVLVLVVVPAIASAEPAADTGRAQAAAAAAEQKSTSLAAQRAGLAVKFQQETDAVDRLKKEKASWRRDRELRASLADSADTANQLAALEKQLAAAQTGLASARRALVQAIDAELASSPAAARAQELTKLRAQVAAQAHAPKKIVIPDAEIDPLADPEDLDKQAADLRQAELELGHQAQALDVQAKDLAEVADVRKHHERAIDMSRRDDDQPFRNAQHGSSLEDKSPSPTNGGAGAQPGQGGIDGGSFGADHGGGGTTAFEAEATVVLGNVLDHATIDGLARASRSGDPAQRADAAKRAGNAVRARMEMIAKKRAAIEARSKALKK